MKKLLAVLAFGFCSLTVRAQNLEGQIIASQYGQWQVQGYAPNTYTWQSPTVCNVKGGASTSPAFKQGTPVKIIDGNPALTEIVTPSNVVINNITCAISIAPLNNHQVPWYITSATGGLQEALNNNLTDPAQNMVVLDNAFYQYVGSANVNAVIAAAKGGVGLNLVDVTTSPYNWYAWNGTQYILVPVGGSSSGNISGNLTAGRLVLSTGPQTITSSTATDNGTILTYPGNGGIAAQKYTMGTPSSNNYAVLGIGDDNDSTFPSLQLFGSGGGQGTTVDVIGVFTPQVATGGVITGSLLVSGVTTLGTLQNGNPGEAIHVIQNGGGATTLDVQGGLHLTGPLALPSGTGTAGQAVLSQGTGLPPVWGGGGGGGGSVTSVFGRAGVVAAQSGDYSVGQVTGAAPLASPALTGTPTAPTQGCGTSTAIATLAYVANCGSGGGSSPITALGQIISGNTSGAAVAIAGNTAAAIGFLSETGKGTAAALPVWQPGNGTGNVVQTVNAQMVAPDVGDATGDSLELNGLFTGLHGAGAATYTAGASSVIGTGGSFSTPVPTTGVSSDSFGGSVSFTTGAGISAAGVILTITLPNMRHNIPSCTVNIGGGTVALGENITGSNTSNVVTLSLKSNVALANNTAYQANWGPCNGN